MSVVTVIPLEFPTTICYQACSKCARYFQMIKIMPMEMKKMWVKKTCPEIYNGLFNLEYNVAKIIFKMFK